MLSEPNNATIIAFPTMFINMPNNANPRNIVQAATILPGTVTGYISPYPTVVSVTTHHHIAWGTE
jgi:hypothetical protein